MLFEEPVYPLPTLILSMSTATLSPQKQVRPGKDSAKSNKDNKNYKIISLKGNNPSFRMESSWRSSAHGDVPLSEQGKCMRMKEWQ